MHTVLRKNLCGEEGNYLMPFFWQHGETEETLRRYMKAIYDSGIRAVCVESRPHPDFLGPKWWADLDVILDEARTRQMQVWILDDSHFPTGYANGALETADPALCRQSIVCTTVPAQPGEPVLLTPELLHPVFQPRGLEPYMLDLTKMRQYTDDRLLSVAATAPDGTRVDLTPLVENEVLHWTAPQAGWQVSFCTLSRNLGYHRNYINMLSRPSCRVLIDTVYEPHYARYAEDFGTTIAGFFSDEPELGNGHLYAQDNPLGSDIDLPWSDELEAALKTVLGDGFATALPLLWDASAAHATAEEKARVRYAYMDQLTRLVAEDFSQQMGDWCRSHGVAYIGHLIEDNNQHARTGSSLGHFFRGLLGQDMAGIDDIGGQVLPQGEDLTEISHPLTPYRDSTFYHYALAKLGVSLADIDPLKQGRTMCEIFGAYGWSEGVRLEKYLADHFMVRGVNRFVPHAFSAKPYPDPDCPPHFYADGHDPQYRAFSCLVRYMNRVCGMIDGGVRETPVAILYHGEGEWTGEAMRCQVPARILYDRRIDFDFLPQDVFLQPERYNVQLGKTLAVHRQRYRVCIVPRMQFVSDAFVKAAAALQQAGCAVVFLEEKPQGVYQGTADLSVLDACPVISTEALPAYLAALGVAGVPLQPESDRIRVMQYHGEETMWFVTNEAAAEYDGVVTLPVTQPLFGYDAWENRILALDTVPCDGGTRVALRLRPADSLLICVGQPPKAAEPPLRLPKTTPQTLVHFTRSLCKSVDYPAFGDAQAITLPEDLAAIAPMFSGYVRYETVLTAEKGERLFLEITDVGETAEVFVNGISLGIQIPPLCRYDLTPHLQTGENLLCIEVATTAERDAYSKSSAVGPFAPAEPVGKTGITGAVRLYRA